MNRNIFFTVILTCLMLAHHGYAGKTRVAPDTVNLFGDQVNSLSLVGVQSDGKFIVGNFDIIDGKVHKNFARMKADGELDSGWGNTIATYTSLIMDGDDVYAKWTDGTGNQIVTRLDAHGAMGTNWVYTTKNNIEIVGENSTGIFVNDYFNLTKVNKQTGIADWSYRHGNFDNLIIANKENCIIENISSFIRNNFYKIDNATGALNWNAYIGDNMWIDCTASDATSLYYGAHNIYSAGYHISRIDIASGVMDSSWVCGADAAITSLSVDDTGIYAGGYFTQIGGEWRSGLAKIDKISGLSVSNWNVAVPGLFVAAFQTDITSIYAFGLTDTNYLAKIDKTTASVDWTFPIIDYNPLNVMLAGTSVFLSALNADSTACFAKFDKATGAMQAYLGSHFNYHSGTANCIARQSDGKMYVSGDFIAVDGKPHTRLVRLNTAGNVDNGWRCDNQNANEITVDDTGLYTTQAHQHNGMSIGYSVVSKVTESPGTAVANWQYRISGYWFNDARTHVVVDANSVYVGGEFSSSYSTANSDYVVKMDKTTGDVDFRWNSGKSDYHSSKGGVNTLAVDGGSVYVGGSFNEIGGRQRNHLAKLNKISGKADASWNAQWPYIDSLYINVMALDGDFVYVGGSDGRIVKLDKAKGYQAWHCYSDQPANSLAIDGNWLYVGGGFATINGANRSHVARLNKITGVTDPTWIHNTDGDVASVLVTNGICYIGGSFTKIGLQDHFGLGAILPGLDSTPGDFDGDHIADLALYQPGTGQWKIKLSSMTSTPADFSMTSGPSWIPVRGDFDGDGRTDPALYSPDLCQFAVKASAHGYDEYYVALGGPDCIPMPGDYDNDGVTDFMVCLPLYGLWTGLLSSSGFTPVALPSLGGPGWLPVVGDFNGDGACDPAVYNEATGQWRILDSSSDYREIDLSITLGGPGFQAMAGDFDGDGFDDFAVYSPITGEWQIAFSAMGYAKFSVMCGGEGFAPIPGDYDGDGITDIGVYCAEQGQGIALMSSTLTRIPIALGGPGYRPCNP